MAKWMVSGFSAVFLILLAQAQPAVSQNLPAVAVQKSVPIPAPSPTSSAPVSSSTSASSAPVAVAPNAPPYEAQLLQLAQALGSLHYLTGLCEAKNTVWRDQMNALLAAEKPDSNRLKRLISGFNSSYRSYADNYEQCTPQALKAIERFKQQGETLTSALLARYGN